jgi:hypothetical protein
MAEVTLQGSAFSSPSLDEEEYGPDDVTHHQSRWQISRNAAFSSLLLDTWWQSDDLTELTYDLPDSGRFWWRVAYRDNYGIISDWSDAFIVTLGVGGRRKVVVGPSVTLPEPTEFYKRDNEAAFRFSVERAIQETQQLANASGRLRDFQDWKTTLELDDDEEVVAATGGVQTAGQIQISVLGATTNEGGLWHFAGNNGNAVVSKIAGTTNTADTDSDTDLCVYTGGQDIRIKNRLGESVSVVIQMIWR